MDMIIILTLMLIVTLLIRGLLEIVFIYSELKWAIEDRKTKDKERGEEE